MGKLFWLFSGGALFYFFMGYSKGQQRSGGSFSNSIASCARDGVNVDTTYSEALSFCRYLARDMSLVGNSAADARGFYIFGAICLGLAIWRGASVLKNRGDELK